MSTVLTISAAGTTGGIFRTDGRATEVWAAVLNLDGATAMNISIEGSDDKVSWSLLSSFTVDMNGDLVNVVTDPPMYVRVTLGAQAAPAWAGSIVCGLDVSGTPAADGPEPPLSAAAAREFVAGFLSDRNVVVRILAIPSRLSGLFDGT